jgi:hypothetical protein
MRRRPVVKGQEPTQQLQLFFTKAGNIRERIRPGQHRQQAQQQHLIQRINHLARLPRVRKPLKILKKNNSFP